MKEQIIIYSNGVKLKAHFQTISNHYRNELGSLLRQTKKQKPTFLQLTFSTEESAEPQRTHLLVTPDEAAQSLLDCSDIGWPADVCRLVLAIKIGSESG